MGSATKPFALFCFFSIVLLGLVPGLSVALGLSMDFAALAERASAETGVPWTSNLWDVTRLSVAEPGLWLLVLGSSVPTLAAFATLAVTGNRDGWRDLRARCSPFGPEPVRGGVAGALRVYGLLVLVLVLAQLLVFELRGGLAPGEYSRDLAPTASTLLMAIAFAALLDQGALLEEGGWRGYATPELQGAGVSPLRAALLVGVAWGLWHVPRDVVSGVIERLGFVTYWLAFLPLFVLGTVTTSVVASYAMNRLGGSLLPAIIVHGLANDAMGFSGAATIERALTPFHQGTKAIPFTLLAVALVWATRGSLGHSESAVVAR